MNNSKLAIDSVPLTLDRPTVDKPRLREQEQELALITDALRKVQASREWSTLKEKVFDGLVDSLTKELHREARKETPDALKLNRIAGQLIWAEKYADLPKLEDGFRLQILNIKKQLYGKTEEIG